ncbi:nickel pincer cofactor-dependent isomerase, group 22 [Nocardioides pyridinolyticus]
MPDLAGGLPLIELGDVLSSPAALPDLVRVRRKASPAGEPLDVAARVRRELAEPLEQVSAGDVVALAVGSRGIARLAEVVRAVVDELRRRGAEVRIVPAMGSHGGATEAGQLKILAGLGIDDSLGVPIDASMRTARLGAAGDDLDVHMAASVLDVDRVLLVNRLKSHTSFSGAIESGLAKMSTIGLGKQRGAEELHRLGPLVLEDRIVRAYGVVRQHVPVLGGIAVTEAQDKSVLSLDFVGPDDIGGRREAELLDRARRNEARLPFDRIDVLIVDRMGKDISGTGMDTNVLGRRMVRGSAEPPSPHITNVVVLDVTAASGGNAVGLGLADFVPHGALERVDLAATYANALTAGLQGVQRAQIPIVLATPADAVTAAVTTAGVPDPRNTRVARIRSTLALDDLLVSPALLAEADDLEQVWSTPRPMLDEHGELIAWDDAPAQEKEAP